MANATRFVVLEHDHPTLHWDLMLEFGAVLRTWRLTAPPSNGTMLAEAIADHRLAYLTYEGPVSGGRGAVKRWDAGVYRLVSQAEDKVELEVEGAEVCGHVSMLASDRNCWVVTWTLV